MSRDVHLEAEVVRVLARGVDSPPVRLAAVYGMVAAPAQQVDETRGNIRQFGTFRLGNAVAVPFGKLEHVARSVCGDTLAQRPVRHTMACGIAARHEAAACRRAQTARICLGKHHALPRQALHVGGLVTVIIERALAPERQRGILPPHVIDHEEHDIGPVGVRMALCLRLLYRTARKGQGQRKKDPVVIHIAYRFPPHAGGAADPRRTAIKIRFFSERNNSRGRRRGSFFASGIMTFRAKTVSLYDYTVSETCTTSTP